ncbi:MAG: hypothetical protein HY808_12440 [Nitrospirae bacterium]|nr:hypothetical protein [Nitrospirota bacterium]
MPPLNAGIMKTIAKVTFLGKNIDLPIKWKDMGSQYGDAFQPEEKSVAPVSPAPPNIFKPVSLNKYHIESVKVIGKKHSDFIDSACDAIGFAVDMWKLQAKFQNIIIMAVSAIGTPGCLSGPGLGAFIKSAPSFASATAQEKKYAAAVADAFDQK